ncbi:MAG TPA: hypothetical protein VJ792_05135 [Candidatus Nitrosotalea sp.]|nr:hypothetical protein [Candidatus Nitrosotalea sp.]
MNGVNSQKIGHMDVGIFWKRNAPVLRELGHKRMPPKARLVYKDVSTRHDKSHGTYLTQYDLVNFYDNRKNLLKISVEFGEDMSIRKEEISVGNDLLGAIKTTIEGMRVTSPGHIRWLQNMTERMVAGDSLR